MTDISKRLQTVASLVTKGRTVADIGCDHAYTAIYLIKQEIARSVLAMDVRIGPLGRAEKNILRWGLENKIKVRLSDGLAELKPGETQVLLLSGMGGLLMERILTEGRAVTEAAQELVLQPQSEYGRVRRCIHRMGFALIEERMLKEDGKYYVAMKAQKGPEKYDREIFYRYGKLLLLEDGLCFREYLEGERRKKEFILRQMAQNVSLTRGEEQAVKQREKIKEDYRYIKEALKLRSTALK